MVREFHRAPPEVTEMRYVPRSGKGRRAATYDPPTSRARPARLTRLRREDMAGRSIPDAMKAQLAETGIPVAPRRIEHVTTPREAASSLLASGRPLHRLTE
ncbi:predicted protein [Streptomyces albidoflavus]|nr:predicted protein [Streptomyces albidoflavus]